MQWLTKTVCLGKGKIKSMPLQGEKTETLVLPRLRGMTVPQTQARDLKELAEFFDKNTKTGEAVLMFPELGALNFILDRPFVGRFPMASLSWIDENWYEEWVKDVQEKQSRYAVVNKQMPDHFEKTYFQVAENRVKFDRQMGHIRGHYHVVAQTPSYDIYARNPSGN